MKLTKSKINTKIRLKRFKQGKGNNHFDIVLSAEDSAIC
jgi:hypothetical protein